jgi:CelD/BcsL family acetyltransferase involved in cellulose biosynthesis
VNTRDHQHPTLTGTICRSDDVLADLAADWDRILSSCSNAVHGPDATCSSVWARALQRTLLKKTEVGVLVVSSGQEKVAIVPTYRKLAAALPFDKRELRIITEAHGGRRGLLVAHNDPEVAEFTLQHLCEDFPAWDVLLLGAVKDTPSYLALTRAAKRAALRVRSLATQDSPYIELGTSMESLLAALPKKTRWTIRKGERDLLARGSLQYEHVSEPGSVEALLTSIYLIESKSWKEDAGTSVTAQVEQQTFYDAFVRIAAECGILSAHVLRLSSRPIAYILGVTSGDGVFLDLKESFDASDAECSPGHVLKRFAIEALMARGVGVYDFMGRCEPYKMRWTSKTYRCETLALYNRTIRGSICYVRTGLAPKGTAVHRAGTENQPTRSVGNLIQHGGEA